MKHAKTMLLSLALVLVAVTLVGASCETTTTTTNENANTAVANTNTAAKTSEWTASTSRGDILDAAISGKINGKDVAIAEVQITKWDEYYSWSFSDTAADETCGLVMENDEVVFDSKDLQEGTYTKTLEEETDINEYYAYYVYNQEDGTPMSVNNDYSAIVVVSELDETNKIVTGWAKFEFEDGLTELEGSFTADLCE